tara:strand:+ start:378 stop:536 length:159 start_codon:yes stop_codon:yes gene_type:complete
MKKKEIKKLIRKEVEQQLGIYVVVEPFYCDVIVGEEGYRCKKQCDMCKGFPK